MNEEDYACDNFAPQKWRKDICRVCYQPRRLHAKKQKSGSPCSSAEASPEASPKLPAKASPVKPKVAAKPPGLVDVVARAEPKVFQRFRVNRDSTIDKSVPARERTEVKPLEGITQGTVAKIQKLAPKDLNDLPEHVRERLGLTPRPPPPPRSSSLQNSTESQSDSASSQPPTTEDEGEAPLLSPQSPPAPIDETEEQFSESVEDSPILTEDQPTPDQEPDVVSSQSTASEVTSHAPSEVVAYDPPSEVVAYDPPREVVAYDPPREVTPPSVGDPLLQNIPAGEQERELCVEGNGELVPPALEEEEEGQSSVEPDQLPHPPPEEETQNNNEFFASTTADNEPLVPPPEAFQEDPQEEKESDPPRLNSQSPADVSKVTLRPKKVSGPPPPPPPRRSSLLSSPALATAAASLKDNEELLQSLGPEEEVAMDNQPVPIATPPPPPPLPPLPSESEHEQDPPPLPSSISAHSEAMSAIRDGVSLRNVGPPQVSSLGEEKVIDVASELRHKMREMKKEEAKSLSGVIEEKRKEINAMVSLLRSNQGTPTFLHILNSVLEQVDQFLKSVNVSAEDLALKAQWPQMLVDNLRRVVEYMHGLELRVVKAEKLCKKTLETQSVNPVAVERCVQDVISISKEIHSRDSRFGAAANCFPVHSADISGMLGRAADAITPLMDRLYEKALQSHQSVYDPTINKYDLSFRVQNSYRQLQLCCKLSDELTRYLQVPKHALYSDAQLNSQALLGEFKRILKVSERAGGDWDDEEQVQLQTPYTKRNSQQQLQLDSQKIAQVIKAVCSGEGEGEEVEGVTEELFTTMEIQLIKAAVASGNLKVVDRVMALREKFCADEESKHHHDLDWLLEAVAKKNHDCLCHLVQNHSIPVDCQSSDAGNSALHRAVQRLDLPTVACLIRLGADPLLFNNADRTPLELLALKSFPPYHFTESVEEREPLFDISSYINNPSLSDVVLVSEDGERYHAHRLVLCAQSPVLKTMLDSDLWTESHNNEIPFPTVHGRVLQGLLHYLYTGRCLFPRDDLNLGVELMAVADQFLLEPMKLQCERVLSEKIDAEIAVQLYQAAFRFSAHKLLANSCHFLLSHYGDICTIDTGHEALLHLLDNTVLK